MSVLGFILYCLVAAVCAGIADYLAPGRIPGGFLASVIVGIIGAWIGAALMGSFGPALAGVSLLPAILGSALLIFLMSLFGRARVN
ncbi:MAG: GlsB/YeaQ/YmgE family stress response membrane protein [Candidatus Obscuribacterales bacterium]|nr:GlsB/YeaQ/YmgE family stress response membrane protein [Candidatus Obscuribacterales bacterium]